MVETTADPVDGLEGAYVDGGRGGVHVPHPQLPVLVGSERERVALLGTDYEGGRKC